MERADLNTTYTTTGQIYVSMGDIVLGENFPTRPHWHKHAKSSLVTSSFSVSIKRTKNLEKEKIDERETLFYYKAS